MKRQLERSILNAIEPDDAQDYLTTSGWQMTDQIKNKAFVYSRDDFYSDLVIPISKTVSDYALRYAEAISLLAEFHEKKQQDILQDIMYFGADVAKFRIDSPKTIDGTIPMEDAAKFYGNVKHIVISSARSVIETKAKYPSGIPTKVKDLYDRARIGQTEVGSYVISVIIRHTKTDKNKNPHISELPFERLAFDNMNRAIARVDALTDGGLSESQVDESIFDGVSYNLCKHLSEIQSITHGGNLDINFQWSKRLTRPEKLQDKVSISYSQKESMDEVASLLGKTATKSKNTLYGMVIGLLRPEGHSQGKVTVHVIYEGRQIKMNMMLPIDKYLEAVKAHEEELQIRISGEVERVGNYFSMPKVTIFEVMEDKKLLKP